MEQSDKKRKFLSDITNTHDKPINRNDKGLIISPKEMLPKIEGSDDKENYDKNAFPDKLYLQNVHPFLAMYKHDLVTEHMSYADFT